MNAVPPPVRLGLLGCGRLAELGYAPAIAGLDGVVLSAVADPDPDRRELLARLGTEARAPEALAGAAELVAAGRVDAVIVASPAAEHVSQAELAARAGLRCLVEKPPAPALAGAERLAALDPAPSIGFNRRFQHGTALLTGIPDRGPLELELELDYRRRSWRPVAVADDVLADLAPHLVDLAILIGGGASVRAASASRSRAEIELETARGPARISCASDRPHRERITVRDGDGRRLATSSAGGLGGAIAAHLPGREHPLVGSLRDQLAAFAALVRGGDPPLLATADDGVRAMRVIDEARIVAGRPA